MTADQSVSRTIDAPAEQVWDLIADLPNMGKWSSENQGGSWVGGATGPAVGAKFRGSNRNGVRRWSTKATVTEATRGESFAFRVVAQGIPIAEWRYELEPTDTGCSVTESWTDRRPQWFKPLSGIASGVSERDAWVVTEMTATLDAIAKAAEQSA